jgi:uncharacterized membrane protein YdjX (TVP38/TMEM64 family)
MDKSTVTALEEQPSGGHKPGLSRKPIVAVLVIGALMVTSVVLPVGEYLRAGLEHIRGLGPAGYAWFVVLYVAAAVLFLPGSILTLGAGAVFGLGGGFLAVSAGSTLGAGAAFLVGRFLARDTIARKLEGNARFGAIDRAVGREGFKIVLLTRLSPVFPFNLLNYAYGLTRVGFGSYILASWIGMMPGTVLYVYLGTTAGEIAGAATGAGGGSADTWSLVLRIVGLLATVAVTMVITRTARKALAEATEETTGQHATLEPAP